MNATQSIAIPAEIRRLFDEKSPVLVEVRFVNMGTSSDWYLCQDLEEYETLAARDFSGVEFHLQSVWELQPVRPIAKVIQRLTLTPAAGA